MTDKRVILGLDPATRSSGWAVLDLDADRVLDAGVFVAVGKPPGGPGHRVAQLLEIHEWAARLVAVRRPVAVVVETVFFGANARTGIRLAEVGAVVRLAAAIGGFPIVDVAPAERWAAVGLPANSGKAAIVRAVNMIYTLDLEDHNAADAVAIAAAGAGILKVEQVRRRAQRGLF